MSSGPPPRVPYTKPWLSVADQLKKLESRGLLVTDRADAEIFLRHINYYRFTGYCVAFENPRHVFPAGVTFDHVKASCQFDASLRDLFNEALEIIEIDLRTVVAHYFGNSYGAFGHTDPASFHPQFDKRLLTTIGWTRFARKQVVRGNFSSDTLSESTRSTRICQCGL
jgi:abortive infection bacteriophage resistance protein